MKHILDAIMAGDTSTRSSPPSRCLTPTAASPSTRTSTTCSRAWPRKDKDPRKSLHVDDVPLPELGPGEALVAVMATAINYNTVWTSIFEPMLDVHVPRALRAHVPPHKRHDLPYHIVGSDLAGVVLQDRTGRATLGARRPGRRALPLGRARVT